MITHRRIEIGNDDQAVLAFHCEIIFGCESPWARQGGFESYRRKWLSTSQPNSFLSDVRSSMSDPRTVAELWEESHRPIAYVWATVHDIPEYDFTYAEVRDIAVAQSHRRQGLGKTIMDYVESQAMACGAKVLRSEVGIENVASQGLHQKVGYQTYRLLVEKVLEVVEL